MPIQNAAMPYGDGFQAAFPDQAFGDVSDEDVQAVLGEQVAVLHRVVLHSLNRQYLLLHTLLPPYTNHFTGL